MSVRTDLSHLSEPVDGEPLLPPQGGRAGGGASTPLGGAATSTSGTVSGGYRKEATIQRTAMADLAAGDFLAGSDTNYPEERPAHVESVGAFRIDEHPVTNAEFRWFVRETDYVTVAEQPPVLGGRPGEDAEDLGPGSLVFRPTAGPVPLDDWRRWWHWVPGASWRCPEGGRSTLAGRDRHPVVHVAYEDALAYARWSGKQLPTEFEWEYAARAGRPATTYSWGDELRPRGRLLANIWQGQFPFECHTTSGPAGTSPYGRYRANSWGLYDMIGNVWEWTISPWAPDHSTTPADAAAEARPPCCSVGSDDLRESDRRVIKGGSFLCCQSYCRRYRPPARQGQTVRSSTSHIGFRCVIRAH
jgi:formylglycine-generating enzyme required for sulfatase activity